jgi:lipopolysaccharide export system protein LptA
MLNNARPFIGIMVIAAAFALVSPATAQQNNMTGLKLSGDKPIQIESDKLEVRRAENIAVFTGNVSVVQGPTLMKSKRMVVHYTNEGAAAAPASSGIESLEVDGKVYVKSDDQVATGDAANFDMKSEVLVMTGKQVVLTRGDNVAVGCKLTVYMQTGRAVLDSCEKKDGSGRIKILITPNSAKNTEKQ